MYGIKGGIDMAKDNPDKLEAPLGTKIFCKTVLLPIAVSYGDYCFGHGRTCSYFDNEGGWPRCEMRLGDLEYDENDDVKKPTKCMELKEV